MVEGLDWPLPVDLSVRVEVLPVRLVYRDPATGRQLTLRDLALRLTMPSLADQPIDADLRGPVVLHEVRGTSLRSVAILTFFSSSISTSK